MFNIGDKVVHPSYGAGSIIDIQEKQIGDEQRIYYMIDLLSQGGMLMVPVAQASDLGLRPPVETPKRVLRVLTSEPGLLSDDHRKRQEMIGDDIRSGNVMKISEAVRDLAHRDRAGKLTEADLKLYRKAQDFLVGELALSQDIDLETARDLVGSTLEEVSLQQA